MQDQPPFYPLKATSKSLPATRTNRLRLSWFVVGVAVGVAATLHLTPYITHKNQKVASQPAESAPVTQTAAISPEVLKQIEAKKVDDAKLNALVNNITERPIPINAEAAYPLTLTFRVEGGDTLISILTDTGVPEGEANAAASAIGKAYDLKKLDVGQNITIQLDKDPDPPHKPIVQNLILPVSLTASLEFSRRKDDTFEVKKSFAPTERKLARAAGKIESSLYETGVDKGLTPPLLANLINAYSYDVDFQRDIKRGDMMDVLYERMETKEGIAAGYGNILYAKLDLGKKPIKIYRYVDKKGNADFYNAKGESVRKALLRTPVNGIKITSRFGLRSHPILGYTRMHRGVDFGAPFGTPIYAAGDGTVKYMGPKSGYGNYLSIQHNKTYATAYAHISRFASSLRSGGKVKQGQIIAYVGATGLATGPHLHYEVLQNGTQVNPSGVKFKTGTMLAGKELTQFRKNMGYIETQLAALDAGKSVTVAALPPEEEKPAGH